MTKSNTKYTDNDYLDGFSQHIFWDVDREKISLDKNKKWLIQRVLEYGLLNDWKVLLKYYGISEIAEISVKLKNLDIRTASLVSVLSGIPVEKFLCTTTDQSIPKH